MTNAPKPGQSTKSHRVVVKDGVTRILDEKPAKKSTAKPRPVEQEIPTFKYKRRDHLYQKPFQSLAEYLGETA